VFSVIISVITKILVIVEKITTYVMEGHSYNDMRCYTCIDDDIVKYVWLYYFTLNKTFMEDIPYIEGAQCGCA